MKKQRTQNLNSRSYKHNYRSNVLFSIQNKLLNSFEKHKQKVINEFALKQRKLSPDGIAGFRFGGACYLHELVHVESYAVRRLVPELNDEFYAHFQSWKLHDDRQIVVNNTIINALMEMGNMNDLREMLPECIHPYLPRNDAPEPCMSFEDVIEFKDKNEEGLKLIKFQLVMSSLKGN